MSKPLTDRAMCVALHEAGCSVQQIAARLGMRPNLVSVHLWHARNPERVRQYHTAFRRRHGIRPLEEVRREQCVFSAKLLRSVNKLLDKGMSTRQAAKKLGMTIGQLAGHVHRARQREAA